jgi:hypothetical protein
MTFTVYDLVSEPYTIDLETLDDLTTLSERYGWEELVVDMRELTILVGRCGAPPTRRPARNILKKGLDKPGKLCYNDIVPKRNGKRGHDNDEPRRADCLL